jgi:hypothetical protein
MAKTLKDQMYLGIVHELTKGGITGNAYNRFGNSSYNAGGFDNNVHELYWALPGSESHINVLEKFFKRHFFQFLKKTESNPNKALEYVDPTHKNIDVPYISSVLDEYIKRSQLNIKKLNEIYLPSLRTNKNFAELVRANHERYLIDIT